MTLETQETRRQGAVWQVPDGIQIAESNPFGPLRLGFKADVRDALRDAFREVGRRLLVAAGASDAELADVSHPAEPIRKARPLNRGERVVNNAGCVLLDEETAGSFAARKARERALWAGRRLLRRADNVANCGFTRDRGGVLSRREDGAVVGSLAGEPYTYEAKCGCKLCVDCGGSSTRRRQREFESLLVGEDHTAFVLGTLSRRADSDESLVEALLVVMNAWTRLRKSKGWREAFDRGIASIEVTWSTPDSRGKLAREFLEKADEIERRAGQIFEGDEYVAGVFDWDGEKADRGEDNTKRRAPLLACNNCDCRGKACHVCRVERMLDEAADLRAQAERLEWEPRRRAADDGSVAEDLSTCRRCRVAIDVASRGATLQEPCTCPAVGRDVWFAGLRPPCRHKHRRVDGAHDVTCIECGAKKRLESHWHVHMHFLAAPVDKPRTWREALDLRAHSRTLWAAALDVGTDECHVHIERPREALSEVVKYCVKGLDVMSMPRDRLVELVEGIEGKRMIRAFGAWHGARDFSEWTKRAATDEERKEAESDPRSLTHDPNDVVGFALGPNGYRVKVRRWEVEIRSDDETRQQALLLRALAWEQAQRLDEIPIIVPPKGKDDPPLPPLARLIVGAEREPGSDDDRARVSTRVFNLPVAGRMLGRRIGEKLAPLEPDEIPKRLGVSADELRKHADTEHRRIVAMSAARRRIGEFKKNPFPHRLVDALDRFVRNITDEEAQTLLERGEVTERFSQ